MKPHPSLPASRNNTNVRMEATSAPRILFAALALCATPAAAEVTVYNATQSKMKVDVTMPNGKVESSTLDEAVDSVDDSKWSFGVGVKTVKVSITDDAGAAVWSGTVGDNASGVIVPTAKGATYVPAGTYTGGSNTWRAAVFMNITGDPITIDLVGQNGLASHRGIATGHTLDVKKAVKLDPREASFSVQLNVKGAEAPIELDGARVTPGSYYLLWKRSRDSEYRLLNLGYLPPPPKSKK